MKVALVHDWLTGMRGGEKVLERFAAMFPAAPIYTLVHEPGAVSEVLERHEIRTSFIQHLPARHAYRWYLPLFPLAVRGLDLTEYDLVLSSSHCAVKAVRTPARRSPSVLLPHPDALRMGSVRRVLLAPARGVGQAPAHSSNDGGPAAMGPPHGAASRRLHG